VLKMQLNPNHPSIRLFMLTGGVQTKQTVTESSLYGMLLFASCLPTSKRASGIFLPHSDWCRSLLKAVCHALPA